MKSVSQTTLRISALLAFSVFATATYSQVVKKSEAIPTEPAPSTPVASVEPEPDELIVLTPFEIATTQDKGYQATETLAGTRIRTDLKDVGSAISVYTKEFMKDIGATGNSTLLQYTTNAEVAGVRGTYTGLGNGATLDETANLRQPAGAQRVRGLAAADNTRDFFVTDIPWDSYNVDRIDIQRGANSFLFGLGSPAGIVNAALRNAEYRDKGSVEVRVGSYGSVRKSLDLNYQLIPGKLAIRLDGLWNDEKYRQRPAFQNDHRLSGAVRFDPDWFKDSGFKTSIKVKYEQGDITANRPRNTPPNDSISAWFREEDPTRTSMFGGMNKRGVDNGYAVGSNTVGFSPWLGGYGDQQQPIWFIDGTSAQLQRVYGGYINVGARNTNGSLRGAGEGVLGKRYSGTFFGLNSFATYATNANLPQSQYGQYRSMSLLDDTVFDFYNKLIDGTTKSEFENWHAYNIDFTETAFNDRLGFNLSLDNQQYKRGGESLLGWAPTINIDVLKNFQDFYLNANATGTGITNPNFGRPYIAAGPGGGNSYQSDRKFVRASLYGELRATDLFEKGLLTKILGRHRFNGVYSGERYATESRNWQMYAHSREWDGYWNGNDGSSNAFTNRPPIAVVYLGNSLADYTTNHGANIPGITGPVTLQDSNVYAFDSTWVNYTPPPTGFTNFNAPYAFATTSNLNVVYDPTTAITQASNPANYVGWNTNRYVNLLRYANGSNPSLLTKSQKLLKETTSYAGSWQGYLWNDAVIPSLGWRYDSVTTRRVNAQPISLNRSTLNFNETGATPYALPSGPADLSLTSPTRNMYYNVSKEHSTFGGAVVHLNKLFQRDLLPINISLSYNKSNNFDVGDSRRDIYGKAVENQTGRTKDIGLLLSTKNQKYSFRVVKYETYLKNASTQLDVGTLGYVVQQGLKFRNVFLYKLSNYPWSSREQNGDRNTWAPAVVSDTTGRPVGGSTATVGAGQHLQTQLEADTMRDATINAWNAIQKKLEGLNYFGAWSYTPTTSSTLTDRATYAATLTGIDPAAQYAPDPASVYSYSAIVPQGFTVTADTVSKGYEFELTANPLPNWRLAFNASQTKATRTYVGSPVLDEFVNAMDTQMAGPAGDMRQFSGGYAASNEVRYNWNQWRSQYTQMKLQVGADAPEIRKWRYNVVSNYSFNKGWLKGAGVGASYRWQDKVVIGYPVLPGTGTQASFDLNRPYYGPSEDALDGWLSYECKLTPKIGWKVQLNVRNAFVKKGKIPISVQPDGQTWASVRIKPVQEWFLTNSLMF